MRRTTRSMLLALAAIFAVAAPAAAAAPTRETFVIPPWTLEDALAEYESFGAYDVDCGTFHIISTFEGTVTVTDWGDRMLRHVVYTGRFYNASDLTKSAGRIGNTATWREFDANGEWVEVNIHGVQNMAVLPDGRHVPVDVGYSSTDMTSFELIFLAGPHGNADLLCEALG